MTVYEYWIWKLGMSWPRFFAKIITKLIEEYVFIEDSDICAVCD